MTYRLKQSDVNEKKRKNSVLYITFEVYKSLANASNHLLRDLPVP